MLKAIFSVLPGLIGLVVLTGWTLDQPVLERVGTTSVSMNPATAICVILSSLALVGLGSGQARRQRPYILALTLLILLISLAKLSDLAFGTHWNVDNRLFAHQIARDGDKLMAPNAALAVLLISCSMALAVFQHRRAIVASQILALLCGFLAFLALIGYIYGTVAFYGLGTFTPMALHTGVCFLLLCFGLLGLNARRGIMNCISNNGPSGRMSRLLLPAAVVIPVSLGALFLWGTQANRYTPEFGNSLSVVLNVAALSILSWIGAQRLYIEDLRREKAEMDLRREEQALKTSEENFRSAMENASIGMALIDLDGRWITVNASLCALLGFTQQELMQTDFQARTHPDDLADSVRNARNLIAGNSATYEMEKRYFHKDGHVVWVQLNVSLALNPDGSRKHLVAQMHDLSERKEMDRVKSEFISIVSHELRTPLTSIQGSLGLVAGLMPKDMPGKIRGLIDIALRNSERLSLLINDILDIDKIAAGQMHFDVKPEKLAPLLAQIVEANSGYAQKYAIRLEQRAVPPDLAIAVDASRFAQVMANLISNAAKFSPQDGVVEIFGESREGAIRISVADSGPGIPEEFHPRIFTRFSQADSSSSRAVEGTGLGLNITREIVKQMGGLIGFDTKTGLGTTFWVEFPPAEPR